MDEKVFLTAPGVMVSSSRIEIHGQTFATRNVGSVKVVNKGVSAWSIIIAVIGVVLLMRDAEVLGLCMLLGGAAWAYQGATRRTLKLMAGGGEVVALQSNNGKLVESVRAAVAEAISVR